ncbi:MAG: hypothetical protein PVJ02_18555 [Gemmatimonadota bacterium]|jgi:hypothetical protein
MKRYRVVLSLGLALLAFAGCSSPTSPRLPQPDTGNKKPPPPDQPGVVAWSGQSDAPLALGIYLA